MSRHRLAPVALAVALTGCAGGSALQGGDEAYLAAQSAAAVEAQESGDPARALAFWRSVLTLDPNNPTAVAAVDALQVQITQDTASALRQAQDAYKKGRIRDGDRWMLRALALTPGQEDALAALRNSDSNASHAKQNKKSGVEVQNLAKKQAEDIAVDDSLTKLQLRYDTGDYRGVIDEAHKQPNGNSEAILQLVGAAHLQLAERAAASDEPEKQLEHLDAALASASTNNDPLRRERTRLAHSLSDDYYKQGLALLKTDLSASLSALERSVDLNPSNIAAREKLDQAEALKRNLEKIRSN